jgi:hypothetical protein
MPTSRQDAAQSAHWFTDSAGVSWHVKEVTRVSTDLRQTTALVFESNMIFRRVRDFPANWRELSDRELEALSWHR